MWYQVAWIAMIVAFAVLEGITISMVSIWFCFGSAVALIANLCGAPLSLQMGLFALVSILAMALLRPFARKYLNIKSEKTNADRIIDAVGVVTEEIDNQHSSGQLKVNGMIWTARAVNEERFPIGTQVHILRIEGVKAIVTNIEKGA
ncbi:MAG: NfeD family protein [Evtepia sp.]